MRRPPLLVAGALVAAVAACTPSPSAPADAPVATGDPVPTAAPPAPATATPTAPSPTPVSPTPSPAPSPAPAGPPETGPTWSPGTAEVEVAAKQLAADVALHLATHDPDAPPGDRAASVPSGAGDAPDDPQAVLAAADALHRDGQWSRGRVVSAVLGGLTPEAASVMVGVEQRWRAAEAPAGTEPSVEVRTLDVRLRHDDRGWRLDAVASSGGPPATGAPPSAAATALLEHPRVSLPDSARWDVLDGTVEPALADLLARIGDRVPVHVTTFARGHPVNVFATDHTSRHTIGRAVDIHVVDDVPVVAQRREDSPAHQLVRWLYEQPDVANIGSPWALDGFGGRSFTDPVHQDHLHVVVRSSG